MPTDPRQRSGVLALISALLLGVSTVAFFLDGDTAPAVAMGILAVILFALGAVRLSDR